MGWNWAMELIPIGKIFDSIGVLWSLCGRSLRACWGEGRLMGLFLADEYRKFVYDRI